MSLFSHFFTKKDPELEKQKEIDGYYSLVDDIGLNKTLTKEQFTHKIYEVLQEDKIKNPNVREDVIGIAMEIFYDFLSTQHVYFATECNPDEILHFIKHDFFSSFEYFIETCEFDDRGDVTFHGKVLGHPIEFQGENGEIKLIDIINPLIREKFHKLIYGYVVGSTFNAILVDTASYTRLAKNEFLKKWVDCSVKSEIV